MDVISRYLFAYPVHTANAATIAKVIMDIMCKRNYLPITLISDKGPIFVSQILAELAAALGIQMRHAITKHAQTIGIHERAHGSVKVTLKMTQDKFSQGWYK